MSVRNTVYTVSQFKEFSGATVIRVSHLYRLSHEFNYSLS